MGIFTTPYRRTQQTNKYKTNNNNKQQTTNNKQQTTNNKQQTTNNKRQTTNDKRQTTSDKRQATSDKRQATNDKRQTTIRQTTLPLTCSIFKRLYMTCPHVWAWNTPGPPLAYSPYDSVSLSLTCSHSRDCTCPREESVAQTSSPEVPSLARRH